MEKIESLIFIVQATWGSRLFGVVRRLRWRHVVASKAKGKPRRTRTRACASHDEDLLQPPPKPHFSGRVLRACFPRAAC